MAEQVPSSGPAVLHRPDHTLGHVADVNQVQLGVEVFPAFARRESLKRFARFRVFL